MSDIINWISSISETHPGKAVAFVSAVIGLAGGIIIYRYKTSNKLKDVKIGGNFTGGNQGVKETASSSVIKNDLKSVKIDGDYTGGHKK